MAHDRRAALPVYRLRFEHLTGLTVVVRRPGLGGLLDIAEATAVLRRSVREEWPNLDVRNLRAWRRLSGALADSLVSWDLVADGEPVAPTMAGVLAQDLDFLIELVRGWQQAIQQDLSLGRGSDESSADGDDAADDDGEPEPYAEGEEFDSDNPRHDPEWLAQLPVLPTVAEQPDGEAPVLKAVSDAQ